MIPLPSDIPPASMLFAVPATRLHVASNEPEGPITMTLSLWPILASLTALAAFIAGAVVCERLLAEAIGDHMIAVMLLLIVMVFAVTWVMSLFTGSTRS